MGWCLNAIEYCILNGETPLGGGGGGAKPPPPDISQATGPIPKFQTSFDSPVCELPEKGQQIDLEVTNNVTAHVTGCS